MFIFVYILYLSLYLVSYISVIAQKIKKKICLHVSSPMTLKCTQKKILFQHLSKNSAFEPLLLLELLNMVQSIQENAADNRKVQQHESPAHKTLISLI